MIGLVRGTCWTSEVVGCKGASSDGSVHAGTWTGDSEVRRSENRAMRSAAISCRRAQDCQIRHRSRQCY